MNGISTIPLTYMESKKWYDVQNRSDIAIPPFSPVALRATNTGGEFPITFEVFSFKDIPPFSFWYGGAMILAVSGPVGIPKESYGKASFDWPLMCHCSDSELTLKELAAYPLYPNASRNALGRSQNIKDPWWQFWHGENTLIMLSYPNLKDKEGLCWVMPNHKFGRSVFDREYFAFNIERVDGVLTQGSNGIVFETSSSTVRLAQAISDRHQMSIGTGDQAVSDGLNICPLRFTEYGTYMVKLNYQLRTFLGGTTSSATVPVSSIAIWVKQTAATKRQGIVSSLGTLSTPHPVSESTIQPHIVGISGNSSGFLFDLVPSVIHVSPSFVLELTPQADDVEGEPIVELEFYAVREDSDESGLFGVSLTNGSAWAMRHDAGLFTDRAV